IIVGIRRPVPRRRCRCLGPLAACVFFARLIIAVVVGVVVVVLVVLQIDIVENNAENAATYSENGLFNTCQHGTWETAVLDDDNSLIHFAGQDRGVAHT